MGDAWVHGLGGGGLEGEKIDFGKFGRPPSLLPNIPFNFKANISFHFKDALCQNVCTGHGLQGGLSACYTLQKCQY